MRDDSLQAFLAFNEQLLALHGAGISVTLPRGGGRNAAADIQRLNAAMALHMGQGASLAEALDHHRHLYRPSYRAFVEASLQSGDMSAAMAAMHAQAETAEDASASLRMSLLYPLVIFCVAYVGLVVFCLLLVPRLQGLLVELRLPQGTVTEVFGAVSRTLPYWVAIPPVALFAALWWLRHADASNSRWLQWLPGTAQAIHDQRSANFANTLASALEADLPLDEALRATTSIWGDRTTKLETRDVAVTGDPPAAEVVELPAQLPAFLRWAVRAADPVDDRVGNLRMAAEVYRTSAARRLERLHVLAPALTCIVIGGGVTLAYGLLLFIPVAHLLRALSV